MILRELSLQNFRSYGSSATKIELDKGVLLFEGDIGSGKSSILYAIEFALFGMGELEARSMLRSSANTAKVELEFGVGTGEYKITRTIERKRGSKTTTIQTRGWIEEPRGKVSEFSPTELRSRILQILNFKEKQSAKASSRIYRYAVFTPQELMKEVLSQKAEDRLDTLRRAFGVEDYSFATNNAEIVIGHLEKQIEIHARLSSNLQQLEVNLEAKSKEILSDEATLGSEENILNAKERDLDESRLLSNELEGESKKIAELRIVLPLLAKSLKQLQSQLFDTKGEIQRQTKLREEIVLAEKKLSNLKQDYERYHELRDRLRELERFAEDMRRLDLEIAKLNQAISSKETGLKAEADYMEEEVKKLRLRISSYEEDIAKKVAIEEEARDLKERVEDLPRLQIRVERLKSEIGSSQALLASRRSRIEEGQRKVKALDGISKESKCPLCGQSLNEEHLRKVDSEYRLEINTLKKEEISFEKKLSELNGELNVLEKERSEGSQAQKELETLEQELARIRELRNLVSSSKKEIVNLEASLSEIRGLLFSREFAREIETALCKLTSKRDLLSQSLKEYENLRMQYEKLEDFGVVEAYQNAQLTALKKSEVEERIIHLEGMSKELEKQVTKTTIEISEKSRDLEEGEPIVLQYSKIQDEMRGLEKQINEKRIAVQILQAKLKQGKTELKSLNDLVEEVRKNAAKAQRSRGLSSWLSDSFLPAIADIERHVLSTINEEFAQVFQKIFSILVVEEGDLSVTIDDRFTPIIEQGGYEMDVQSLSGGERTAVALAYRLALNYMVKRANETLQTNLLILDEPTEGFSKEQIYRFRNALEELASDQVIIVSHERDLEPMADRVYRIEKENGESIVTIVSTSST